MQRLSQGRRRRFANRLHRICRLVRRRGISEIGAEAERSDEEKETLVTRQDTGEPISMTPRSPMRRQHNFIFYLFEFLFVNIPF